ncbi:MAG: FAD-dependent oxidoreductase [[Clostridium] leptum]
MQLRQENREKDPVQFGGLPDKPEVSGAEAGIFHDPGPKNAEFVRYGVMHRNTFIDSPRLLRRDFSMKTRPDLFFAGQLTGLEGYLAAMFSGLLAGKNAVRRCQGRETLVLPRETMMGALSHYISDESVKDFQPMGANFGILPPLQEPIRDKRRRYGALSERSLERIEKIINSGV